MEVGALRRSDGGTSLKWKPAGPAVWLSSLAIAVAAILHADGSNLRVLTRAKDVRELPAREARREYPVRLRGVVTFVHTSDGPELYVQDSSSGIFIFLISSHSDAPLRPGLLVDVAGVTTAGDFSPCVRKAFIRVLGKAPMPRPLHPYSGANAGVKDDGQRVEVVGVVHSVQIKDSRLFLDLIGPQGRFLAAVSDYPPERAPALVDSRVRVRGALAPMFNERRQSIGLRVNVSRDELHIVDAGVPDPFHLPAVPLGSVGQFRPGEDMERRIHVSGAVAGIEPRGEFYLSDGRETLAIQSTAPCPVRTGEPVDVVGFPNAEGDRPGLQDAVCRSGRAKVQLVAVRVRAEDLLPRNAVTDPFGLGMAAGTRFDLRLIQTQGTVL